MSTAAAMPLSDEDKQRVEAEVERMVRDYRAKPSAEKEDQLGLELFLMPPEEREYTTSVFLALLAAERG